MTVVQQSDLHTIVKLSDIKKALPLKRKDFVGRVCQVDDFFGYSLETHKLKWNGDVYRLIEGVWAKAASEVYPMTQLPVKGMLGSRESSRFVAYRLTFGQTCEPEIPAQDLSIYLRSDGETRIAFLESLIPDDPYCRSPSVPLEARALYVSTIELPAGRATPPERTERIYLRMSQPK